MKQNIIVICSTCPFKGEVFLRNEIECVGNNQNLLLFPIRQKSKSQSFQSIKNNIHALNIASRPVIGIRLLAIIKGLKSLFRYDELKYVCHKKQSLRNLVKAIKFAYIAESRAEMIDRWLKLHLPGEQFIFYSYWFYETAYVAAKLKEMNSGSKFVSRCHGYDLYEERHANGYIPFRRFLLKSSDRLFPISGEGKTYLEKVYGDSYSNKIYVRRLGTFDFGVNVGQKSSSSLIIVSCSNLVEVKRVCRVIEILEKCKRNVIWYHFGDGILFQQIKKQAQKLPRNIEYCFMGSVPNEKIMQFYREQYIDVFLNVSLSEGVPVSIMEAISFGIPVVATDVGGTHEIVHNNQNGVLLDVNFNPSDALEAILKISDLLPEENIRYRLESRKIWLNYYNGEDNYRKFYNELQDMEKH